MISKKVTSKKVSSKKRILKSVLKQSDLTYVSPYPHTCDNKKMARIHLHIDFNFQELIQLYECGICKQKFVHSHFNNDCDFTQPWILHLGIYGKSIVFYVRLRMHCNQVIVCVVGQTVDVEINMHKYIDEVLRSCEISFQKFRLTTFFVLRFYIFLHLQFHFLIFQDINCNMNFPTLYMLCL